MATCGACGNERPVTSYMRRERDSQFQARPKETTDSFYCRCQDQDADGLEPW